MTNEEMTSKDFKDVLQVCGTALEIENPEEQLTAVLFLLERIFKTGNNNFYFAESGGQRLNLNRVVSRGIESKYFTQFKQYYYQLDPFYQIASADPPPTVVVRDHSKNRGRLAEYYSDFLKPQAIHHQMSIYLNSRHRFLGVLGLYRPPNTREFSVQDQTKAGLLAPYLAKALENALTSEQKNKQAAIIDAISAQIPHQGIMVFDEFLDLVYQNENASDCLATRDAEERGLSLSSPFLPEEIHQQCQNLLSMARSGLSADRDGQPYRLSYRVNNKKMDIQAQLINNRHQTTLLLLYLTSEPSDADICKWMRQYGLSHRQAEVVFLLNKGLTNKEIGSRLYISTYTVENHLKSIFQKMNVKNRTELSYRLQQTSAN